MDFEVLYGTWYQGGQNLTDTFFMYGARTWAYYDIWWRMDFFQSYYLVDRWVISFWDVKPWAMTLSTDVAFAKGRNCFQMWWSMLGPNIQEQVRENMKVLQLSLYDQLNTGTWWNSTNNWAYNYDYEALFWDSFLMFNPLYMYLVKVPFVQMYMSGAPNNYWMKCM
jgi:hypothetical protein